MATNSTSAVSPKFSARCVDVQFEGDLPYIQNALVTSMICDGKDVVLEVAQELGERTVRCHFAMDSTDGMVRGNEVRRHWRPASACRLALRCSAGF